MSNESAKIIRLEICQSTFAVLLTAAIGLTVVGFTAVLSHYYTERVTAAFSAGYEEGTLPGRGDFAWVKQKK